MTEAEKQRLAELVGGEEEETEVGGCAYITETSCDG